MHTFKEGSLEQYKFIPLNEILSYGIAGDLIHIHLEPAEGRSPGEKMELVQQGLRELAKKLIEDHALEGIKTILATSWIVAAHPRIMEKLGFKVEGPIDEKMRREHFADESRPVGYSHMSREQFLELYGGQ